MDFSHACSKLANQGFDRFDLCGILKQAAEAEQHIQGSGVQCSGPLQIRSWIFFKILEGFPGELKSSTCVDTPDSSIDMPSKPWAA